MKNIAEILKNCPKGTKLYSPIFGEVELDEIHSSIFVRHASNKALLAFYEDGKWHSNGECMLLPSKENRDWSTFERPFKDGDVAISERGGIHLLRTADSSYCAYRDYWKGLPKFDPTITTNVKIVRFATEEEKQKLFDAIKENGYKWNAETKTLEKLAEPKFKIGDRIKHKQYDVKYHIIGFDNNMCIVEGYYSGSTHHIPIKDINSFFELISNKFDISTLKPFDKVLVRDYNYHHWRCALYERYDNTRDIMYFATIIGLYQQCIPFEGNEHLLGTSNDCDEYYKTWK